jgi:hypothetical protein
MPILSKRPWGPVDWTMTKLPGRTWSLIGCLGPEERSLGLWEYLTARNLLDRSVLVSIAPQGNRYFSEFQNQIANRDNELSAMGRPSEGVWQSSLFATSGELVALADRFLSISGPHVILDISTFPKRFFFALVKKLLGSPNIDSIVVTYTLPETYEESLAEDHVPFASLPLFGPSTHPEPRTDVVVVGAGFMKLGLTELLDPYKQDVAIKTIIPFPPGMPTFHRNWEFIREMQQVMPEGLEPPVRIDAFDCSDTFEHLIGMTNSASLNAMLAPFGPKPMSLAFCLYAIASGCVAYYTQPKVYNPFYSRGIKRWGANLGAYAYGLRLGGRDLYTLR